MLPKLEYKNIWAQNWEGHGLSFVSAGKAPADTNIVTIVLPEPIEQFYQPDHWV